VNAQLKKTEPRTYLCAGDTTDWNGLSRLPGVLGAKVEAELARLGMGKHGPMVMFYRHDKDPHRPEGKWATFFLEIGIEVDGIAAAVAAYQGPLTIRKTGGEDCASVVHRGPINWLPWKELRDVAEQAGMRTLEEREIYVRFSGKPEDNEIELQCLFTQVPRP
jgi:hypothetical protein